MEWTKDRMRELRLRMGWSQSDLARHLSIESKSIYDFEGGLNTDFETIRPRLNLFWIQAESLSEERRLNSLVDQFIEDGNLIQAYRSDLISQVGEGSDF